MSECKPLPSMRAQALATPAFTPFLRLATNATLPGRQGLTLVHFSAQRQHYFTHVVRCFAGFSDQHSSG